MGGEHGVSASFYAELSNQFLRPSTPVSESPHAQLLENAESSGNGFLNSDTLRKTPYVKNGLTTIDIFGDYRGARTEEEVMALARDFVENASQINLSPDKPIELRRIRFSDCFEVIEGHHQLALAFTRGDKTVEAIVWPRTVLTPLQERLLKVLWLYGRKELYQPVVSPELEKEWILVRQCTDRFGMMEQFLKQQGLLPAAGLTYADFGSSYGWFVSAMGKLGFRSIGVDRDAIAHSIGVRVYGLAPEQLIRRDIVRFLTNCSDTFDVTSLFSVLQYFAMEKKPVSPEELISLVDKVTGKVLFFDTGENHEAWFKSKLPEWSPEFIKEWLEKHTSFSQVLPLGVDQDKRGKFLENYSRTLFALVR